jgi:hypothetical protein
MCCVVETPKRVWRPLSLFSQGLATSNVFCSSISPVSSRAPVSAHDLCTQAKCLYVMTTKRRLEPHRQTDAIASHLTAMWTKAGHWPCLVAA